MELVASKKQLPSKFKNTGNADLTSVSLRTTLPLVLAPIALLPEEPSTFILHFSKVITEPSNLEITAPQGSAVELSTFSVRFLSVRLPFCT